VLVLVLVIELVLVRLTQRVPGRALLTLRWSDERENENEHEHEHEHLGSAT
jgi:hypothetical protein